MAEVHGISYSSAKSPHHPRLSGKGQGLVPTKLSHGQLSMSKFKLSVKAKLNKCEKFNTLLVSRASSFLCRSRETQTAETQECVTDQEDCSENFRTQGGDRQHIHPDRIGDTNQALAEACKFAYNDARYVNERAKSDIIMLSCGIMRLDARARQDVAIIGSGFLKLDARAREDTGKIDNDVKKRAEHLHHIALIFKNKAQSKLKSVADRHWSDGALEADLRRADYIAKQRAMDDALMALEFIKDVHDMMISKMYKLKNGALSSDDMAGQITLEKNGKVLDFFPREVSTDRITAIQEAYQDMASALTEADGIDYTDPEELELLVATLMDLDAMDGKGSVSLLAECSSSPDVNTSLAGALQYLTFTRPDISYAVQQVCLFMHDPREPHFSALKRILRYVRGTLDYGLQLYSSSTSSLVAYSDADWAGCPTTRRSTSGYCVFLGNNLLSWSSKRQFTLSRSSAEAEYRGVANAVAETCWLRNLLRELHTPLLTATIVYCDNVSAVYLSSNPVQHQRTKHIEIDIHFVRDFVATGHVRVLHVPSRYQYADIFTKGLPTALFDEFRSSLSVRSSPAQTAGGC